MPESLEVSETIPASPAEIYAAFLDSRKHSAMTGAKASVDPAIGGKFTAWEEYISGTTIALEPNRRIKQNWRTTDFPADAPDSLLEILLEKAPSWDKNHVETHEYPGRSSRELQGRLDRVLLRTHERIFRKEAAS